MLWYGWLLMWCASVAHLLYFVIRARRSYTAVCRECTALEHCMDLFAEWRLARPFLRVGQSEYAQGLIYRMMGATRILMEEGELDRERGIRILDLLQKLLDEDPPPYDPSNHFKEPRPRLFSLRGIPRPCWDILAQMADTRDVKIGGGWKEKLGGEFEQEYFKKLSDFVHDEYKKGTVYPAPKNIFRAFDECPFDRVKVVILGQDPYHGPGQANGMCFAVNPEVKAPPSLQNIFKELENDLGHPVSHDPDLVRWAQQGVLLLNATLTVSAHNPGSHQGRGWETFTDAVIRVLNDEKEHLVFILWGNYAKQKGAHIDRTKHCVIESAHPSPFSASAGFFGSKPFSKTNAYLVERGMAPIEW